MWGVILSSVSTLFSEASTTIGKWKFSRQQESIYTMGFLDNLCGALILLGIAIARGHFIFSLASLPTFSIRVVLELLQAHFTMAAIAASSRSTFGFLRVLTIPLLLGVDRVFGYQISPLQTLGIALIVFALLIVFVKHGIERTGRGLVLFIAVNAVATLSLYKYDITHYNSVEAEQFLIMGIILIYFIWAAWHRAKENPLRFILHTIFFSQSLGAGIGSVIQSFAYSFAPAAIVLTAARSSSVLWAVVSGSFYFKERKVLFKLCILVFLVSGLVLLVQ